MGLDQYLYAKRFSYPSRQDDDLDREFEQIKKILGSDSKHFDKSFPSATVEMLVGYWRKANAIHAWFVDNCQNGEDDCREADVSREQLKELKALCVDVIKNPKKAEQLLPTRTGFFFGSEEYDECYFAEIKETITIINKCLRMSRRWDFTYRASW